MNYGFLIVLMGTAVFSAGVPAQDDAMLRGVLERRLLGDRTGACIAAAVIDQGVARAVVCADPAQPRRIDTRTAFEIGSVTKTMAATLAASLILEGRLSLDDPLSRWVPPGTVVPEFQQQPIRIRHLLTHSSGLPALPSRMTDVDYNDPYVRLTPEQLYGSLSDVTLDAPPGTRYLYSNFASMLLSDIIARQAGMPFDQLIERRLFVPLQMRNGHVSKRPKGTRVARGHIQTGARVPAWRIPINYAGVGGVRASLDDLVHYVEAQLGKRPSPLDTAIAMTQRQLADVQGVRMGMNWLLAQSGTATVHIHSGGTGGFSSLVYFDRQRGRGVIILCDTAVGSLDMLAPLGRHLLDGSIPLQSPRLNTTPDAALLAAVSGNYVFDFGLRVRLFGENGRLHLQFQGDQRSYPFGFDSYGHFFALDFDALVKPQQLPNGTYRLVWLQDGNQFVVNRAD